MIHKLVLVIAFVFWYNTIDAQIIDDTLCTPNPSKEAIALYRYLLDMKGKKMLTGQMDANWGIDELGYVLAHTGKLPAIKGMDFIHQGDNAGEVQKAIDWWEDGGIPTIMWHWGAPTKGDGYEESKMGINIDNCFAPGTPEYIAFWAELELKGDLLEQLRDANIPVLWRPYHELNGGWFWWGMGGPERFKQLWITMFNYFVNDRGLNNLIWVLCYTGDPDSNWYPGDQYVDIAGADVYNAGNNPMVGMYNEVKTIIDDKFPIAYHECGVPPQPDKCLTNGSIWSWWMEWHTNFISSVDLTYLNYVYNHQLNVTLDEVPDIIALYGWDKDSCSVSTIIPQYKIDSGEWIQSNLIQIDTGTRITFYPQAIDTGIWNWSGLGTSGDSLMQVVNGNIEGIATAVFTNTCGATSTTTYYITDICPPTQLVPYIRYNSSLINTSEINIIRGKYINLEPRVSDPGTWSWYGVVESSLYAVQFAPDSSCEETVVFTNFCGETSEITFKITVVDPTNLNETESESLIELYPSPCNDYLNIDINSYHQGDDCIIYVYSIHGQILIEKRINSNFECLKVSDLTPGIYYLKVIDNNNFVTKSFVVE